MGRTEGRVALITGAARGQGRAHAQRLAEEGADIVALDALVDYGTMAYAMSTEDDLEETARLVRETGRDVVTGQVDVRDRAGLQAAVNRALKRFGKIDIAVINAGRYLLGRHVSAAVWIFTSG
jgi:NAD(P)-dependent dehydrogenase (short-subunit alcohol dehydrogenase family)